MVTSVDAGYSPALRRSDERRGRRDGQQRTPALAEVRRRQQELRETGGRLLVGYQLVLLAEFDGHLTELYPAFQRTGRAMERELREHQDRIEAAELALRRAEAGLEVAVAPLTPEELRPRNPQEERWSPEALRNRRELWRARRIARARDAVDAARNSRDQRYAERAGAERRWEEAMAEFGVRAGRLKELYQRRMATYVAALARSHPDGRTLSALLSMPDIALPEWVPAAGEPNPRAGVEHEEEQEAAVRARAAGEAAEGTEPPAGPADERRDAATGAGAAAHRE